MQLTGQTSTHDLSLTPTHGSAITNGIAPLPKRHVKRMGKEHTRAASGSQCAENTWGPRWRALVKSVGAASRAAPESRKARNRRAARAPLSWSSRAALHPVVHGDSRKVGGDHPIFPIGAQTPSVVQCLAPIDRPQPFRSHVPPP